MKIGVQSRLLLGNEPKRKEFKRIKQAGFDCIDFNLDRFLPNTLIYEGKLNRFFEQKEERLIDFFGEYAAVAKEEGLEFSQIHAPYPLLVYGREEDSEYLRMVAEKSIAVCAALKAPYIVIHPFKLACYLGEQEEYRKNIEFFRTLIPAAKYFKVRICMENLYDNINGKLCQGVCSDFYRAVNYIDELNQLADEECFAFCFDTGHANLFNKNMEKGICLLDKRLQVLHLHDNDGIADLHQMPYTFTKELAGEAATDWAGVIKGLKKIRYNGVLSFETFGVLKCFPQELWDQVLQMIANIGLYFKNAIERDNE